MLAQTLLPLMQSHTGNGSTAQKLCWQGEKGTWQTDPQDPWWGPGGADTYEPT